MRLFLDTSVLLAASASSIGASSEIFRRASGNHWVLVTTPYAMEEVFRNLPRFLPTVTANWARLRPNLLVMDDVFTLDLPVVFFRWQGQAHFIWCAGLGRRAFDARPG